MSAERSFGELSEGDRAQVSSLPLAILEELNKTLEGFSGLTDLRTWIASQPSESDAE